MRANVAVVGLGYVGLPLALLADQKGHSVVGVDCDTEKIRKLRERITPFYDPAVQERLSRARITFTTSYAAVTKAEYIIICVPTPVHDNKKPDLRPVISVGTSLGPYVRRSQVIVLESTVNPGVTESILLPAIERNSSLRAIKDFSLAHCPERINPGDKKWPLEKISRVVGASDEEGLSRAVAFYESIIDIGTYVLDNITYPVTVTPMSSIESAELVKILENSVSDIVIASMNQMAPFCRKRGIDLYEVIRGMEGKNFSVFKRYPEPGIGVGGHCIPVDPYYLLEQGDQQGTPLPLIRAARHINESMPWFTASLVRTGLERVGRSLSGSNVGVLGLSYKPNVMDVRDSPSFPLITALASEMAIVRAYDPYVTAASVPEAMRPYVAPSLEHALQGAHAIVLATAHTLFQEKITAAYLAQNGVQVAVDGRNSLSPEECADAGILFLGIGKEPFTSYQQRAASRRTKQTMKEDLFARKGGVSRGCVM